MWVEPNSGLLLKSEMMANNGPPVELFEFVQLDLKESISIAEFQSRGKGAREAKSDVCQHKLVNEPSEFVRLNWMPSGFTQIASPAADKTTDVEGKKTLDTLVYTDGFNSFSVFVETMPVAPPSFVCDWTDT